ncbi:sulfite exporter TauE/SafE family protein [Zhouia amylolytica]|uniref:Probable membrane transporter protein n=1 Tax=Zhouia amylolytica AD3 TaxID=1286632 RepID=W2UN10_9FLAO|nr:sulfite exporter TauE/SafE family protein [Zhouia amylolytica]ETN95383.1 hypothetical protein P278_11050 [Zhouia amylolytica AD3]
MKNLEYFFLFLALIAEIVGTIGGFGSSVFFVPLANFYFDFQSVLALTALFHFSSNLSKIALFRRGLNKNLLIYIGIPSIILVIIGGVLTKLFKTNLLEIALGAFLVILSLVLLLKSEWVLKPNKINALLGGSVSGFVAGLLGTGGAIRGLTMAAFNLEKSSFIATSAFIDFFVDSSRTIVYYLNGYMKKELFIYIPFLFVIGFIGTYIGRYLLKFISQDNFKRVSLGLILLIGLATLIKIIFTH